MLLDLFFIYLWVKFPGWHWFWEWANWDREGWKECVLEGYLAIYWRNCWGNCCLILIDLSIVNC